MGLGDSAVSTFFRVYREIQAEEKAKMGDVFSIRDSEIQRRMGELTRDEVSHAVSDASSARLAEKIRAKRAVAPTPSPPVGASVEPVEALADYRHAPEQPAAPQRPWWRRLLGLR